MAYQFQRTLPCPKLTRGQLEFLPEQEAFVHQFAQAWTADTLSCEAIDEQATEAYLRQAYLAEGLASPSIRWFDSPVAFVFACGEQLLGNSKAYDMLANQGRVLERLWDQAISRIQAGFPEDMLEIMMSYFDQSNLLWISQRLQCAIETSVWKSKRDDSKWDRRNPDLASDIKDCVQDSVGAYRVSSTLSWIAFCGILFEENAYMDLALFNERVSGYRLSTSTAWVVRKPSKLIYVDHGFPQHEESIYVQYRDGWEFSV